MHIQRSGALVDIAFVCLTLSVAACKKSPALPGEVIETEWIRYHHWDDDRPCEEALSQLDAYVSLLDNYFSLDLSESFLVDYYKLRPDDAALSEVCRGSRCFDGTAIYSVFWADTHELVHAVLFEVGAPPPMFAEGIADMLACGSARWVGGYVDKSFPLEDVLRSEDWVALDEEQPSAARGPAVAFSRYLLDTYSMDAYLRFYSATRANATETAIRTRFEDVFGDSIELAFAEWRAGAEQRYGEICEFLIDACDAQASITANALGDSGALDRVMTCVEKVEVVEFGTSGGLVLGVNVDDPAVSVELTPCDFPSQTEREILYTEFGSPDPEYVGKRAELWTSVEPGRYALRYAPAFLDSPWGGSLSADVSLGSSRVSAMCTATTPFEISNDLWRVVVAGPPEELSVEGTGALWIRLPVERTMSSVIRNGVPFGCPSDCPTDPLTECAPIDATPLPRSGDLVLWIEDPSDSEGYVVDVMFGAAPK